MTKQNRHKVIKELIQNNQIESQEMLLNMLVHKHIEITQATLSRDIKELQIIKAPDSNGNYIYQLSSITPNLSINNLTAYGFLKVDFSGNMGVVKTRPGYAMGIAAEIDEKITHEILGTVAGDDTVLLIIKENIKHNEVKKALSKLIGSDI